MVQVKKMSKYGKYFLVIALASVVSFIWPSKNSGQSSLLPTVPQAHADVPGGSIPDPGGDGGGDGDDDCDSDSDCE